MIKITDFKNKLREKLLFYKPDFDLEVLNKGLEKFQLREYKSGDCIVEAGKPCDHIFIIENSISRCYFNSEDGEDKTIWLEPQMSFITEYESFSSHTIGRCNISLYEDSLVYIIDRNSLGSLYTEYHEWALVGINIVEEHFINLLKLSTTIHFNDASRNYDLIESYFANYLEVVPLKHIASWLNISAVHISRIRAERLKKIK